VGSIKRALHAVVGTRTLDDYRLVTLLTEIEHMVNSRPLTAVSDSPDDLEALTANHFLTVRTRADSGVPTDGGLNSRKRWQQVQYLANCYWKRWLREYLPSLQSRPKWTAIRRNLKVGDLVMIADDSTQRCKWPLARVTQVNRGADGYVRSAEVRTSKSRLTRPIVKIYLLERNDE